MREAAWQNRIDELEQLLREAEEKVNERDAIFLEGVPTTTTTTTTRKEERKRAQESGRYKSSNRSSSSSISSSNDGKNNNNRLTAEGRRKLTTFAAKLSELSSASSTTATASGEDVTTAMVIRSRSATIEQLRVRGEATLLKLKATPGSIARAATTTTTIKSRASVLQPNEEEEEEATTLLQFQHQLLREQDEELTDLSNHVTRTKHIAIAVGEELDLHTRLLDDFDDDVEHTAGNLKRIASSARRLFERIGKSNFSLGCCLAALVFMLIVLIALSILKVEGKFHPIFT